MTGFLFAAPSSATQRATLGGREAPSRAEGRALAVPHMARGDI